MKQQILRICLLLGCIGYLLRRWIEWLRYPSLILLAISSIGLLFYWKSNKMINNIFCILILIALVLLLLGY